jgi:hypothetical protein
MSQKKQKKKTAQNTLPISGVVKFSGIKDYLKHLEDTMGQLHVQTLKGVRGGK